MHIGVGGLVLLIIICLLLGSSGARRVRNAPLGGVCGGLARHFGLEPSFVRLLAIIFLICSGGTAILVYLVLCLALPEG